MKIWWCQEHQARDATEVFNPPLTEESRWCVVGLDLSTDSCRMVPMRLIPDNAQLRDRMKQAVIIGIEKGKEGFANAVSVDVVTDYVLAALDGETP